MNAQLQTYPASEFNLLINGRLVAGASTFDVINPATEELLAVCPRADLGQLNQAVAAAKAAFPAWAATPIAERRRLLLKLADALGANMDDIARVLTDADPNDKAEIFRKLGLKLTYHPGSLLVKAQIEAPHHWYFESVRGGT